MSILFLLTALILAGILLGILASYAFAWTSHATRDPSLMAERFRTPSLRLAARLVAMETLCTFITLLAHPLGLFPPRKLTPRPSGQKASTPVLLLNGLFHNRACWWWMRRKLLRLGLEEVHTVSVPVWGTIETALDTLSHTVDELRRALGVDKIHLVGHSMGGMVARHFIQLKGGADKIDRCILLGAPNAGSILAPLAISPLGKELIPGSDFLRSLQQAPLPSTVRITSVYTRHDNLVIPFDSGRLEGVDNLELAGMGHCGLLYHPEVARILADELKEKRS